MDKNITKQWGFFRAGGFDQVRIESANDLASLAHLDQKLWATLACPVQGLAVDARLLSYLDTSHDGRIRAPEILAAIAWLLQRLATPEQIFSREAITLQSFAAGPEGQHLAIAAQRLLALHGKTANDSVSSADTQDLTQLFPPHEANGDGLIPVAFAREAAHRQALADIMTCLGSATDRSGEPAVSAERINQFYAQVHAVSAWEQSASAAVTQPFGEQTAAAITALMALHDKINDYFTRVALAAYDPRAATIMNGAEAELVRLAGLNLADPQELKALPLAGLQHGATLPLQGGANPAWQAALARLYELAIVPLLGEIGGLTHAHWQTLLAHCQGYFAWQQQRPQVEVLEHLALPRLRQLAAENLEAALLDLVAQDLAVEQAASGLVELDKALRLHEGLVPLLRNFISFQNFYQRQEKAIFQAGRLYIDGKSLDLVVEVGDIAAHSAVAVNSNSFLIYCECKRPGQPLNGREKMNVVAAVTAGTNHELMVGRNGLFYDRDGHDWDATVVKVVENAISVREAFWSPYRRVASLVSNQIQKMAASQDTQLIHSATEKVGAVGGAVESTVAAKPPFDIARFAGIFAAIGLAVGALGTALAALFSNLIALQWWQWPLTLLGLMLVVSGPSMLLAWFKLRRRSLGPLLDANGWAVNTQAKISIAFGATLTQLATLPKGARRTTADPYASRARGGWWLALLISSASALGWWYFMQG